MKALYKIVHTSASSQWQDPEKRILDESLWMQEQGHQMVIVAPQDSPLLSRARAVGLPTYPMSFKGFTLTSQTQQLREILTNEQPNILTAHGRTDGRISLKAAVKAGVPCRIMSRHSDKPLRNSWQNRNLFKKLCHYVFTASEQTARQLKETFRLKDMEIFSIPGGIILPRTLEPRDAAEKAVAEALGLEEAPPFMGLLEPVENRSAAAQVTQLLKAFRQIRMEIPHHLLIPGAAPETLNLLKHSAETLTLGDRVHVAPQQNRWDYYRALACGIHIPVHRYAGGSIPRAMLEAMHASCPVVASQTPGVTEVITHQKTGLLWDPAHPDQAADAIQETLTRPATTLERVHDARELVRKHHTIDAMGRDLVRIYRLHQVRLDRRYHKVDPDLDLDLY